MEGRQMVPNLINSTSAKRAFCAMVLGSVLVIIGTTPPAEPSPTTPPALQFGDSLSPGFFSPPPGVRPVNRIIASRFPNARHSYAWRIHNGKRELIEFSTPIQHIVIIYM